MTMGDPYRRDRRLGRWAIDRRSMLDEWDDAALLLVQREVVIVWADREFAQDRQAFIGRAPFFEIVPYGAEIPTYEAKVLREQNRAVAIEWRIADRVAHVTRDRPPLLMMDEGGNVSAVAEAA